MLKYANYLLAKCSTLKESLSCLLLKRCKTSTDVGSGCIFVIKDFLPKYSFCVLEATAVLVCTVRSSFNIFTILSVNLLYPDLFLVLYPKKNPKINRQFSYKYNCRRVQILPNANQLYPVLLQLFSSSIHTSLKISLPFVI